MFKSLIVPNNNMDTKGLAGLVVLLASLPILFTLSSMQHTTNSSYSQMQIIGLEISTTEFQRAELENLFDKKINSALKNSTLPLEAIEIKSRTNKIILDLFKNKFEKATLCTHSNEFEDELSERTLNEISQVIVMRAGPFTLARYTISDPSGQNRHPCALIRAGEHFAIFRIPNNYSATELIAT